MNTLSPQELANLWYLKFGSKWVIKDQLQDEWKVIGRELMKNNLADYELINDPQVSYATEIIKLKETHANY